MWWNIIKQSKLRVSPKTFTAWKIPSKEEGGDCSKRLKEIADSLKTKEGLLVYLQDVSTTDEIRRRNYIHGKYAETIWSLYNPIPEDIACEVLEKIQWDSGIGYLGPLEKDEKWFMDFTIDHGEAGTSTSEFKHVKDYREIMDISLFIWNLEEDAVAPIISIKHEIELLKPFKKSFVDKIFKEMDWR